MPTIGVKILETNLLEWLANFFTVLLAVSAILGTVGKYVVLPLLDRRINAQAAIVLESMMVKVVSLQRDVSGLKSVMVRVDSLEQDVSGLAAIRAQVVSLQQDVSGFAEITASIAETISQLEIAKKKLAELSPRIDAVTPALKQQKEDLEQKVEALRKELRRTQGVLLEAASNIAQDALKDL